MASERLGVKKRLVIATVAGIFTAFLIKHQDQLFDAADFAMDALHEGKKRGSIEAGVKVARRKRQANPPSSLSSYRTNRPQ